MDPANAPMTPAERHEWIIEQVSLICGEHARSWIFAAEVESPSREDPDGSRLVWGFSGGLNNCLGLATRVKQGLLRVDAGIAFQQAGEDQDDGEDPEESLP